MGFTWLDRIKGNLLGYYTRERVVANPFTESGTPPLKEIIYLSSGSGMPFKLGYSGLTRRELDIITTGEIMPETRPINEAYLSAQNPNPLPPEAEESIQGARQDLPGLTQIERISIEERVDPEGVERLFLRQPLQMVEEDPDEALHMP